MLLLLMTVVFMVSGTCASCFKENKNNETGTESETQHGSEPIIRPSAPRYNGPFSAVNGTLGGTDDLGRVLPLYGDDNVSGIRQDKTVGIFYFLWQGQHGIAGPYDNNKIVANNPDAVKSESAWYSAGGGAVGAHHFWGEPLFGYYTSDDTWVMRKHVQMLTDAGVDYLIFDATNAYTYSNQALKLLKILDEYYKAGFKNVPKVAFYTNSYSVDTIVSIYNTIYTAHPEYSHLWFNWDRKPLIIGTATSDTYDNVKLKDFYTYKASQWPNTERIDNGWPWMEFARHLTPQSVYGVNGRKEVMNVSVAQHSNTVSFSATAWYGGDDRTRSWHNGANDTSTGAINYGYNFAESWEYAIKQDPETIFITGWNEWVAQRQPSNKKAIVFVDCADPNNSRDVEPMNGLFGDNYYIQMMNYIRLFKGTAPRVDAGDYISINMNGSFSQFNYATAKYTDYVNDIVNRSSSGFGSLIYKNKTGRNDFNEMKVVRDEEYITFYVNTASNITSETDRWMSLFIKVNTKSAPDWYGYNYVVNRVAPVDGKAVLEKCGGGWSWTEQGKVKMKLAGNQLMIQLPRSYLGIAEGELINIEFKWADNYGENNIWSFYTDGDAAPYGRLNYIFNEQKKLKDCILIQFLTGESAIGFFVKTFTKI